MTSARVLFADLETQRRRIATEVDARIKGVLRHGRYIMGPEVAELEAELCRYAGSRYAITCSSGTDALLMSLMAWGIGPGDAVIVPAFTFPATAETVVLLGATPVFADVERSTFNIDPDSAHAAAVAAEAAGLRPAALVAVDLFGQPARYDVLREITTASGMRLLGDAAQSFGATWDGRRVGTLADATATSFFPAKPLGCYGDGGAVFTDDDELERELRSIRVHGQGDSKYENVRVGINGRLDTIQAAILLAKLSIFDEEIASRRTVAERYSAALSAFQIPVVHERASSVWAQYTVVLPDRDAAAAYLGDHDIPTAVYYPKPLHEQKAFSRSALTPVPLHVSEHLVRHVLSLPIHPYLEAHQQDEVVAQLKAAVPQPSALELSHG